MSYDDGGIGHRDELASNDTEPTDVVATASRSNPLWTVLDRLKTHVQEWPGRYVDQQVEVYERLTR